MSVNQRIIIGRREVGAEIFRPLRIMSWEEMNFGKIIPDRETVGRVTLSITGARSCTVAICITSEFAAGRFMVTGEPDKIYLVTLPTATTLTNEEEDAMTVDSFISSQTQGIYTGVATVSVEYQ